MLFLMKFCYFYNSFSLHCVVTSNYLHILTPDFLSALYVINTSHCTLALTISLTLTNKQSHHFNKPHLSVIIHEL